MEISSRLLVLLVVPLASLARADGSVPGFSTAANTQAMLGHPFVVNLKPFPGADHYNCKMRQGEAEVSGDSTAGAHPRCTFNVFKLPRVAIKPGPADVVVSASVHGTWTNEGTLPVIVKAGAPSGGAGTKWDGVYWTGSAGNYGVLSCEKGLTITNGVATLPIFVENTSFGAVHAKIEPDGTIIAQTFQLPKGVHKGSKQIFDDESVEVAATTKVTIAGNHAVTFQERYFDIRIDGGITPKGEQYYCKGRFFRKGDGWSRSNMPACPSKTQCGLYADCCPDNPNR